MIHKIWRQIVLVVVMVLGSFSAQAAFHIVQINEVYSNASGTVQFIEISMLAGGQTQFAGQTLTSTQSGNVKSFTFQSNLANGSAGDTVLIGTTGYAALSGVPAPDFIVPNGFIFTSNVTINFAGVDFVTYATIPTDGTLSVNHNGVTATNSPMNNGRATGTVVLSNPATVPAAPSVTGSVNSTGQAVISFTPGSDGGSAATGFTATCTAAGQITRTSTGAASPLTVVQLASGVTYACTVTATNAIGTSPASNILNVLITAPVTVPGAPSITSVTAGSGQATISFSSPADTGGAAITNYIATCGTLVSSGPSSPITVSGLLNGTTYSCNVAAVNSAGTGPQSASAPVTPTASVQVITFAPNSPVTIGAAPVTLSATTTSGLQSFTFSTSSASNICVVSGNLVTFNGVGSCALTAFQAGDTNFASASASAVIVINAVSVTLSVTLSGDGLGSVAGGGINCPSVCSVAVTQNDSVTLTASPNIGSTFSGWSGAGCSGSGSCIVKMALAQSVTATFAATATAPGAPVLSSILLGAGSATLNFTAPSSTGGLPIAGYTATCSAAGQVARISTGSVSPITVSGLSSGVAYSCSVTATNAAGLTGKASAAMTVTPLVSGGNVSTILMYLLE